MKKSESSNTLRTGASITQEISANIILSSAGRFIFLNTACKMTTLISTVVAYSAVFSGEYPASPAEPASLTIGSQTIGFKPSVQKTSLAKINPSEIIANTATANHIAAFSSGE